MKKSLFGCLLVLALSSVSYAGTVNLGGLMWDLNVEPDIKEYELFRTDVVPRVSVCKVQHPTNECLNITVTVPDGSQGTITIVGVARDTSGNNAIDSNIVTYTFDYQPPAPMRNLRKK